MAETKTSTVPPSSHALLRTLAFGLFGYLAARRFTAIPLGLLGGAVLGAVAGFVLLGPMRWVLWLANPAVRKEHGYKGVGRAVGTGFAGLVPFALLAFLAEMSLGWDALSAFAIAGLMAGATGAGLEVSRLGGKPVLNLVLGAALGFGLALIWTFLMLLVQADALP